MNKQEEAIELAKGNILIHLALSNAGRTSASGSWSRKS